MPPAVSQRWNELKQRGDFEQAKAELSLLAMPEKIKSIQPRKISDVLRNDTPTLATVKKYHGLQFCEETAAGMMFELASLINAGKGLTIPQVALLADYVCEEYYYLTLADLALFVRMAATGKFGEVYDRLDTHVLSKWLDAYAALRTDAAQVASEAKHRAQNKAEKKPIPMPPEMSAWLADFAERHGVNDERPAQPFEVDAAIEAQIVAEYDALPDADRTPFTQFRSLRIAQFRAIAARK